jgi:GT2 family glycosyltransferase
MENKPASPRVTVILLNWNSRLDTLECLESVFRLDYSNFCVVVCDNDSRDGSLGSIQEWALGNVSVVPAAKEYTDLFTQTRPKNVLNCVRYSRAQAEAKNVQTTGSNLVLIENGGNLGFAGGNNIGIRFALQHLQADYVWLLNTDTLADPGALTALVARARKSQTMGMVGSSLIYYWAPGKVQALGGASLDLRNTRMHHIGDGSLVDSIPEDGSQVESRLTYIIGASMLVSRQFIEQIGFMCEDYFLYYEEIDWALRSNGKFELGYAPSSKVFHKVGGASRRVASTGSLRFLWRNRIRFVARFLPDSLPGTLFIMALDMVRAFLKRQFGLARVIAGALLDARLLIGQGKNRRPWSRP